MEEYRRNSRLITNKYFRYFFPTLIMVFSTSMSILVDSIIVSNMLGEDRMASVSACLPILQLFATFSALFGVGASTIISISKGKGDNEAIKKSYSWMWILILIFGSLLTLLITLLHDPISHILTNAEDIRIYSNEYLMYTGFLALPLIITNSMSYIMQIDGRPNMASIMVISANAINLLFDYIFMGPLKMGVKGSALATVVGYSFSLIFVLIYLMSKGRTIKLTNKFEFKVCLNLLKNGLSSAMNYLFVGVRVMCINLIVGHVAGSNGVLAFSICMSALSLESIFVGGVSQTMAPILGIYYGEKDYTGVKLLLKRAIGVLLVSVSLIVLFLELFPQYFLLLYGINDNVEFLSNALRIYSICLIPMSLVVLFTYYYNVIGKNRFAIIISLVEGLLISVPLCFLLSLILGLNGVWIGFIISEVLINVFVIAFVKMKSRSVYYLIEEPSVLEISLNNNNIEDVVSKVIFELDYLKIDHNIANRIGVAIEEYYELILSNNKKRIKADIVIKGFDDYLVVSFCDNGMMLQMPSKEDDLDNYNNIMMLKAISKEVNYKRIIGLNRLEAIIGKYELQKKIEKKADILEQ